MELMKSEQIITLHTFLIGSRSLTLCIQWLAEVLNKLAKAFILLADNYYSDIFLEMQ